MKCDLCKCKLSRIKRLYYRIFTNVEVVTIEVVNNDGVVVGKFPVCNRCGELYKYLAKLYAQYGLEGITEFMENVAKNVS